MKEASKRRMSKRGISTVVTSLLIILLSIVAIGIIWAVVRNVVGDATNGISFDQFSLNLRINSAYIDGSNVKVIVRRDAGQGNLIGIAFIFHNGTSSTSIKRDVTISELEEQTFVFSSSEVGGIDNVQLVSVSPIYSNSGDEIVGSITDTAEISPTPPVSGGGGGETGTSGASCGDSVLNAGEQCDSGTGCSPSCRCVSGYAPTSPVSVNCLQTGSPICGNSVCESGENYAVCSEDCDIPNTCNGVWDGALENPDAECDAGNHCVVGCACDLGFSPDGLGGCVADPSINNGTVGSGWPAGVVKYIDSSDLPKDSLTIVSFIGKYVNFSGPETRCLQISYAEYISDPAYNKSYMRLELPSSVVSGNRYQIWVSVTCGV